MMVRFFRAGDAPEKPRGELLTVARDLSALYPDEWRALLVEATRPASGPGKGKVGRKRRRRR